MDRSGESMNPKDKHADWLLKPTANELADIQAFKTEELTIWERNTTATMLRQQQERLTKYELRHAEQRKRIDELEHQQQAEIEALKVKAHEWYLIAMGKAQEK